MSLPDIVLDDLDWSQMMEAIRTQIAAASAEAWTLHAPVDPGVTLLELLAHALEQRLYWLDQITDPMIIALLALLGEKPAPAVSALTAMTLSVHDGVSRQVPCGTELQLGDSASPIHFRTLTALNVLPIESLVITSLYGQRQVEQGEARQWRMRPMHLLPADGDSAEFHCEFWIRDGLQAGNTSLALFVELDTAATVAPQWSRDSAGPVTPPARLRWQYDTPSGRSTLPDSAVQDGTGGLRRGGIITLELPDDWQPGTPHNDIWPYAIRVTVERCRFSAPPLLVRLMPNVTLAAHERERWLDQDEVIRQLQTWLPLPGLQLQLSDPLPPLEQSIVLRVREQDGEWHDWSPTIDLGGHGPGDRFFAVDRPRRQLIFGDGLTTRIPVPDAATAVPLDIRYLGGGGEIGNLGSGLDWVVAGQPELLVSNPVAASGGRETESVMAARQRAITELGQRDRAVTAEDFESLALSTDGIALARAHAAVGYHPDFPCQRVPGAITLFIVPDVPRDEGANAERWVVRPQPDPGAVQEVLQRLDERRLVTTEIHVRGPRYRPVSVQAVISGGPLAGSRLSQRLEAGLAHYFDPLIGGEAGTGWPFGHGLRPSEIAHQLDTLANGEAVVEELSLSLEDEGLSSDCEDLVIGPHELVWLRQVTLESRSRQTDRGGLR